MSIIIIKYPQTIVSIQVTNSIKSMLFFPYRPLTIGAGGETLPKVTILDLAHKNQLVAKELCSMVCAFTDHHQDRHRESNTKCNTIPDDKPSTVEFTAGEKLAQRVCH